MSSRRTAKAAEAIRETVSTTILFGLKDPRVKNVTVLSVDVAPDLTRAKIHVSVMGDAKRQALSMHGLNAARGYLQAKLAERLQTRNTPVLTFVLDAGVKRSIEASRLLREAGASPANDLQQLDDESADESDEFTEGVLSEDDFTEDELAEDEGESDEESPEAPAAEHTEESDARTSPAEPA